MRRIAFLVIAILLLGGFWLVGRRSESPKQQSAANPSATETATNVQPSFDKGQFSLADPASIWVVVNKKRPLDPKEYVPANLVVPKVKLRTGPGSQEMLLRNDAAKALEDMAASAQSEAKLGLMLASGYRSYPFQANLYSRYVKQQGQAEADTQSARAGYSEHQTGLAADLEPTNRVCEIQECFADTEEGRWLAKNAHRFGFIIRYAPGKQDITGYKYEPWHARYVGVALATEMYDKKVETLEEFFETGAAGTY